jgi:3-methyladenine DNA glycosylase AlkD
MSKHSEAFVEQIIALGNPAHVAGKAKFYQAYPGGYGEGDQFLSISVPEQRTLSKAFYKLLTFEELAKLLESPFHEIRLTKLMMLVLRFEKSKDSLEKQAIVNIYLSHMDYVNNWDLVDSSAHYILGPWLLDKSHDILFKLADENHLWKQRIAVLTTFHFIKKGQYKTTLRLAEKLLTHKHDLIHKAVGWMLREIGNRDYQAEYGFLKKHYKQMPRTMLRYAIEKFDEEVRQSFLKGLI